MQRRPTTQDLTWLLDLNRDQKLDINPPYQRRSVWTKKDKQFFLDTIFRNYPSPALFLHKTIDDTGKATYHVVDGKQRTQTVLDFVEGRVRMASNYGDIRLDGKKWSDLHGETELKQQFWNYQITVEMIEVIDGTIVNEVFDRLNRNARKLTPQELRHAKYDGWFIRFIEEEAERQEWRDFGIVTPARSKRMLDIQFLSELFLIVLEGQLIGFDQNLVDELYAKYEDPSDTVPELNPEDALKRFATIKRYISKMESSEAVVSAYGRGFGHFLSLWALVALNKKLPSSKTLAAKYASFMKVVQRLDSTKDLDTVLRGQSAGAYAAQLQYLKNSRGASTDLGPRTERMDALKSALLTP